MQQVHFFAERSVQELEEWENIARRYPDIQWIDNYQTFPRTGMRSEKNCVIFARKRGSWLKPFHCYHQNSEFRFLSLDVAEGCSFDCVYCYLQSYLNHGALVLFLDDAGLREELQALPDGHFWISTGLLSDSLLSEQYHPLLPALSRMVPRGSVLELRTKSDRVDLLSAENIDREAVVISCSLNPDSIAQAYEFGAASTSQRIAALQGAVGLGYRVGLHFDPVFFFKGWRDEYQKLFDRLATLNASCVAFISVGLFRYMPDLGAVIRKRFSSHPVLAEEFFVEGDGKYHYFRPVRREMYGAFQEWLAPWREKVPIFWSMEPDARLIERI